MSETLAHTDCDDMMFGVAAALGACNPSLYEMESSAAAPPGSVPLTLLPQDKGGESPACLDGSPYGFYFVPSKTGSTRWTMNINGGGWCYDPHCPGPTASGTVADCADRARGDLGSSAGWARTREYGGMLSASADWAAVLQLVLLLVVSGHASMMVFIAADVRWSTPTLV